jgi:hypothetical protein
MVTAWRGEYKMCLLAQYCIRWLNLWTYVRLMYGYWNRAGFALQVSCRHGKILRVETRLEWHLCHAVATIRKRCIRMLLCASYVVLGAWETLMWGICVHWLTGLYCFIHGGSCIENKVSIILQLCIRRKASPLTVRTRLVIGTALLVLLQLMGWLLIFPGGCQLVRLLNNQSL